MTVSSLEFFGGILCWDHSNESTEQYFPWYGLLSCTILCEVLLTFESVDEFLKCDHSNEATVQYFPVLLFIMLYKVVLTFESR